MVELEVFDVYLQSSKTGEGQEVTQSVLLLRERGGSRVLPIWIGELEATAIAMELQDRETARPLTYHFTCNLLEAVDVKIQSVTINKLVEKTFYAAVSVKKNGRSVEVDARPSDAISMALRANAPIFAEEEVIAQASTKMEPAKLKGAGSAALLEHLKELPRLSIANLTESEQKQIRKAWQDLGIDLPTD